MCYAVASVRLSAGARGARHWLAHGLRELVKVASPGRASVVTGTARRHHSTCRKRDVGACLGGRCSTFVFKQASLLRPLHLAQCARGQAQEYMGLPPLRWCWQLWHQHRVSLCALSCARVPAFQLPAACDALKVPASKCRKIVLPGLPSSWELRRVGGSLREPPELRLPQADPLAFLEQHRERLGAHTRAVRGLAPQVPSLWS